MGYMSRLCRRLARCPPQFAGYLRGEVRECPLVKLFSSLLLSSSFFWS